MKKGEIIFKNGVFRTSDLEIIAALNSLENNRRELKKVMSDLDILGVSIYHSKDGKITHIDPMSEEGINLRDKSQSI